jgi:outer membrane immunogenic protein
MRGLWLGCVVVVIPIVQSVPAIAADLGPQPQYAPPVPYFTWTGFYIGGNIGGAWPGGNITDSLTGTNLTTTNEGVFIGGGQIGYNYQINQNVVLGVEWLMDGVASNNNSNIVVIPTIGDSFQASVKSDWFTTLTGRIGLTGPAWENGLVYIKGGAAWLQNQATVTDLSNGLTVGTTKIDTGWVAGAGVEYAFAPNWTIRVEYDYMGFGNSTVGTMTVDPWGNGYSKQKPMPPVVPPTPPLVPPPPTFVSETFNAGNQSTQIVTLGINYKFGAPPPPPAIVTKY